VLAGLFVRKTAGSTRGTTPGWSALTSRYSRASPDWFQSGKNRVLLDSSTTRVSVNVNTVDMVLEQTKGTREEHTTVGAPSSRFSTTIGGPLRVRIPVLIVGKCMCMFMLVLDRHV
jgi:hypothetical protein